MDLILWRHAEAQDARDGQGDLERALTTKGERQAERMAQWLTRRLGASARILVSPALRCQQTVAPLGRTFETVEAVGLNTSVTELLQAAGWPDAGQPVLVVGHQPTLGLVAARLLADVDQPWPMKKGAVWWLRRRERDGAGAQVVLQAVLGPDCV
jgi:phosphohistidine phosphatase